jgi:hypothetical protein
MTEKKVSHIKVFYTNDMRDGNNSAYHYGEYMDYRVDDSGILTIDDKDYDPVAVYRTWTRLVVEYQREPKKPYFAPDQKDGVVLTAGMLKEEILPKTVAGNTEQVKRVITAMREKPINR